MVSIQSSYSSSSKCRCSSPSRILVSCSFLTSQLHSLSYLSCGDIICGTYCLSSFGCPSYGYVICGAFVVYLATCAIVGTIDGSTLPLIIFCALTLKFSCSFFTPKHEALFFLNFVVFLKNTSWKICYNPVSIFKCCLHRLLLTLADGFYGFPFDVQTYTK